MHVLCSTISSRRCHKNIYHKKSGINTDGVYLWEIEKLGKYFPSEGAGISNIMHALKDTGSGQGDKFAEAHAKYNALIGDHECILANIRKKPGKSGGDVTRAYVRAGPRAALHFNPKTVNAAIITCGGLCPGLNNVVREITRALYHLYGIQGKVYGIVGGYKGFYDPATPPIILTPENVENIHHEGGTILGSSRGGFDIVKICDFIKSNGIRHLYVIGGDGTHRGAFKIHETCMERGLHVAVAGIPKVRPSISLIARYHTHRTNINLKRHTSPLRFHLCSICFYLDHR